MRSSLLRPALALALLGPLTFTPLAAQAPATMAVDRDWVSFLGDCPHPGSEALAGDLAILLWLQRTRTGEDVTRAEREVIARVGLFSAVTAVDLESARMPLTRALLEEASRDLRRVTGSLKQHFARPRPYDADARITPAVGLEHSFSYPSGHAAWGAVEAALLAELEPSRKDAILEYGMLLGNDRAMAGVHFPSDVVAGQRLGVALAALWLQEPEHRRQLEGARVAEWRP